MSACVILIIIVIIAVACCIKRRNRNTIELGKDVPFTSFPYFQNLLLKLSTVGNMYANLSTYAYFFSISLIFVAFGVFLIYF